ncbi:MAG: DUF4142 domain-containing protein [Planctomycetes bacterium]|nr:DUF4142 domain-containing protein [Planctomycetota bacterium]
MRHLNVLISLAMIGYGASAALANEEGNELDGDFLIKMAAYDYSEIDIGKLAEMRAESPQVKDLAELLVAEHRKCADRVGLMMKNRKQIIIDITDKEVIVWHGDLSKLMGTEFDRAYLRWTIAGHQKAITAFEEQISNGKDANIRLYAKDHLEMLRNHLRRAQGLLKILN